MVVDLLVWPVRCRWSAWLTTGPLPELLHLVLVQACKVVRRPVACPCWPPARSRRGRRLVVVDLLAWPARCRRPAWLITGTLPKLLHLVLLQACQVVADLLRLVSALPVAGLFDHQPAARAAALGAGAGLQGGAPASGLPVLATSLKPARPAPGGGRSAGLASALPVAGLVDHRSAARAAAPGAGAGLSGSAPASGLLMLATSSKLARPAPGAGRSAGLVSALPVVGLVDHRSAAQAAAPGAAASLPAVSMLLACAGIPAARTLRGRRLVAELQRLASVLPAARLWSITGTLPKLLHLVALQACRRCPCRWPVPGGHQLEPCAAGAW